jgi:hypothetical protein
MHDTLAARDDLVGGAELLGLAFIEQRAAFHLVSEILATANTER